MKKETVVATIWVLGFAALISMAATTVPGVLLSRFIIAVVLFALASLLGNGKHS